MQHQVPRQTAATLMQADQEVNPVAKKSERVYEPSPVYRDEHSESSFTRIIEQQTAKIPSDWFLFAALGSMAVSLTLHVTNYKEESRFIGMWAPALLTMGVYNKLVKLIGAK